MAAPVKIVLEWQWPADVLAFAIEQNAQVYLDPMLEATRQIFPDARWIRVHTQADAEIPDELSIIFDVKTPGITASEIKRRRRKWNSEMFRICPAQRAVPFVLLLDLGD